MEENIQKKVDDSWKEKAKSEPKPDKKPEELPKPDFKFFLTTMGMQAWIALGAIPNPITEKQEENLDQAKFIIDSLDMLQEKTKGNLDKEEAQIFEGLLYELHMGYINIKEKNK